MENFQDFTVLDNVYRSYINIVDQELTLRFFKEINLPLNKIDIKDILFDDIRYESERIYSFTHEIIYGLYLKITNELLPYRIFEIINFIDTIVYYMRREISIEINEDYYNKTIKRINSITLRVKIKVVPDLDSIVRISLANQPICNIYNYCGPNNFNNLKFIINFYDLFTLLLNSKNRNNNLALNAKNLKRISKKSPLYFNDNYMNTAIFCMNESVKIIGFKIYYLYSIFSADTYFFFDHFDCDFLKGRERVVNVLLIYAKDCIDYICIWNMQKKMFTYSEVKDIIQNHRCRFDEYMRWQ